MLIEEEGIVLHQNKTVNGKKMLTLFTPKYGKVTVALNDNGGGKSKSTLYSRPFTYGKYTLFKNKEIYNYSSSSIIESHYKIGEDLDKLLAGSLALEITDKVILEGENQSRIFNLLRDFLTELENRDKAIETILIAYLVKLIDILGVFPKLDSCIRCSGEVDKKHTFFDVKEGGVICINCAKDAITMDPSQLIYETNFGIIDVLNFYKKEDISSFRKIALNDATSKELKKILISYIKYHFDIYELKSESINI